MEKLIADLTARIEALQTEHARVSKILSQIEGAIGEAAHWLQAAQAPPPPPAEPPPAEPPKE